MQKPRVRGAFLTYLYSSRWRKYLRQLNVAIQAAWNWARIDSTWG